MFRVYFEVLQLKGMDTLPGEVSVKTVFISLLSGMGSTLKGNTLLHMGANSFCSVKSPFRKDLVY